MQHSIDCNLNHALFYLYLTLTLINLMTLHELGSTNENTYFVSEFDQIRLCQSVNGAY